MQWFNQTILAPLTRRVGSLFGGYLTAVGVASDSANLIATGAAAAAGVGIDLGLSWANKKGWF